MVVEVFIPKMTDNMSAAKVLNWLVRNGDTVQRGQAIMEIETDKATVELQAPESGIIKGIRGGVAPGAEVPVGEIIAFVVTGQQEESVPTLEPLGTPLSVDASIVVRQSTHEGPPGRQPRALQASPAVRRIANELGVDLILVQGTGPGGRIREADVRAFAEGRATPRDARLPTVVPPGSPVASVSPVARRLADELGIDLAYVRAQAPHGRITKEDILSYAESRQTPVPGPAAAAGEWLDLNRMQLLTGNRMLESVRTAPQFALTVSVDMTRVLALREVMLESTEAETRAHVTLTAILVKVMGGALRLYPRANASFIDGRIRLHKQVNVGVAVGSVAGLVVPVIHDADAKSLGQIALELRALQDKAERMRFAADDLTGGTFTISNLGMAGIEQFQAIINPSETAILAVGQVLKTPVGMPDDAIALRPMMKMTLSVDHRSLDGVMAAAFLSLVKDRMQEPDVSSLRS
jgi:pyruvate dehydrogenase E2 component (dihydrolipoamide acetyltransferase)